MRYGRMIMILDDIRRKGYLSRIKTVFSKLIFREILVFISVVLISTFSLSTPVLANPQGGQVRAGSVTIHQAPNSTTINQSSQRGIINWQSFNINKKESTHFQQPAGGMTLNRISPTQGASQIYGRLTSTGQIILVNPAGIYFGPSAYVNVGGLIATTANITDQNFLNGNFHFVQEGPYSGSIINAGRIIAAKHGLVALIGSNVSNTGLIQVTLGQVILASGNAFTMEFAGNQLISFAVDEKSIHGSSIRNTGTLRADGGQIVVTANTASGVLDNAINLKGVVEARSVGVQNGELVLYADSGVVTVAAKIDVSGKRTGEKGGKVKITAPYVLIDSPSVIDVSGDVGGGEILLGGNYLGRGPLPNANATVISANTNLIADAITNGNGGNVIVWSKDLTKFYGNISARGGKNGGDGGFIETSSKDYLEVTGAVDASAPLGRPGMWLLDPSNVNIVAATANGSFDNGNPNTFTTTANTATVNVATINASLNGGTSVTILTTPGGTQAGTITVTNAILKSAGFTIPTLTLNAVSSITINNTISATSGGLDVTLIGDSLALNSAVTTNGGNFLSTTQNAATLANAINVGTGTVAINVNQDGAGTNAFVMNAGSSITTTNTSTSAVAINVNTAAGGTGTAALRSITTGSGGTISIATNTGGNTTGGSITMPAGTLNVGTGAISLTTSQTAARAIGTSALNIQMIAGNLTTNTGSGGTFVTNTGTSVFNLGANTGTGSLSLISLSSAGITNNGTLTLPGTLTIAAGAAQDITLTSAANNFGTVTITSGRNVNLLDTNAIVLGASTISGTLGVTAGGSITQSGILTVTGTPTFTLTTPNTDVSLASQANNFSSTPVYTSNGTIRDLLLRNTNATALVPALPTGLRNLTLTFNNAGMVLPAMTLTGTLGVTSNGSVTQTGALTVAGTPTFTLTIPNSDILLADFPNAFTITPVFTGNGNIRDIALRRSLASAVPTLPAGLRNLTLIYDAVGIILPVMTLTGNLSATVNGSITQTGVLTIPGTSTFTLTTPNSDVSLASQANNFSTTPVYTNNGNIRDLLLRNTNAGAMVPVLPTGLRNLTLTFNNAAMVLPAATLTGTFTATALGNMLASGNFTTGGTATIIVNTGTFSVADAAIFSTNNSTLNITATDLNLNTTGALNSGGANTAITQNTATGSIGLGNTAGTMTISGAELQRITSNNLTLIAASNGLISVDGTTAANSANISGTTILTATAGTLGVINFLNSASTFRRLTANADNGMTVGANLTTTVGNLALNADIGGGINHALMLNADLTAAGAITLSAASGGIVLGAPITLTGTGITLNPAVTGAQNLIVNAGTGTARFNSTVSIANLTVSGGIIAINSGSITTTGDQTYNDAIDFGPNTTFTAQNVTFNDDVTGNGQSLILIGQPGDNSFTLNGTSGLASITVNGSGTGNDLLSINTGSAENWLITGNNQGAVTSAGITGIFNFSQIQNLTGGSANDSFVFSNGIGVSGVINGGAGSNSFDYSAYNTPITMNLANSTATGTSGFSNIQAVTGGSVDDTLIGTNTPNIWNITGTNAGNIGNAFNFASIENLTGGNAGNTFAFSNNASISGLVDGVNTATATNTLDYSLYNTPITTLLANLLYSGDTKNNQAIFITHFMNINNLNGSTASVLQLPDNQTTLTFNSEQSGFVTGPLTFNHFNSFITPNNADPVIFVAHGIYDVATKLLTINGFAVGMNGFNSNNFSGNITFVNGPQPTPPIPPLPPIPIIVQSLGSVPAILIHQVANNVSDIPSAIVITNNTASGVGSGKVSIEGASLSGVPGSLSTLASSHAGAQKTALEQPAPNSVIPERMIVAPVSTNAMSISRAGEVFADLGGLFIILGNQLVPISLLTLLIMTVAITRQIRAARVLTEANNLSTYKLTTISFKIRTALNNTIGFVELLYYGEMGQLSAKQKEFLLDILSDANGLLSELAKLEAVDVATSLDDDLNNETLTALFFKQRTTLNNIIGFAGLIYHGEVGNVSDQQKLCLQDILSGSKDILQLIPID